MISKIIILLFLILFPIALSAQDEYDALSDTLRFDGVLRPVLFRSEFTGRITLSFLKKYSQMEGYDAFGYPKLDAIVRRDLHFWETAMAQSKYYREMFNYDIREFVINNPEKFSSETVSNYLRGDIRKNPVLADGSETRVHHARQGFELVRADEHTANPHTGGNKIWGYKYAEKANPNQEILYTAQRWGYFAAIDFALSSVALAIEGEDDWKTYAVNAAASTTAGAVAWGVESLLISSFPLLQGTTPMFIGNAMINLGGPASWIATGSFILTKYAIMAGWEKIQIDMANAVEERCQKSEKQVRFNMLKEQANRNTVQLQEILESIHNI